MRASVFRRSPFLLLAALVALAVFLVHDSPRAQAQAVPAWMAELTVAAATVDGLDNVRGCETATICATALSDNTFSIGSTEFTVTRIRRASVAGIEGLTIAFDKAVTSALQEHVLMIGDRAVDLSGGTTDTSFVTNDSISLSIAGLPAWTTGEELDLALIRPYWRSTLAVKRLSSTAFGCNNTSGTQCTTGILNPSLFNINSVSGSFTSVADYNDGTLELWATKHFSTAFAGLSLYVNGRQFRFSDAATAASGTLMRARWSNANLAWAAGNNVKLLIARQVPIPDPNVLASLTASGATSVGGAYSAVTLSPAFDKDITEYRATVGNAVTHVRLTARTETGGRVTIVERVNITYPNGYPSDPIALAVGENERIIAISSRGNNAKEYNVYFTRQSGNANLSGLTASSHTSATGTFTALTLTPSFSAATTSYTASVANAVTHAKLTPTVADSKATVRVGKGGSLAAVTSGSASDAIELSAGANVITVRVAAEDTSITRNYAVTITRADGTQSSDATLSGLTASSATSAGGTYSSLTLSPTFAVATGSYTATVGNAVTHLKLTPTANHSAATVQAGKSGNLATVTSGSASGASALAVGENEVTVRVTAQNGDIRNYGVTVTREATHGIQAAQQSSVWSATLTVKDTGSGVVLGCNNHASGSECSTTSVLTDDDFTHGGAEYHVNEVLQVRNGNLFVILDKAVPESLRSGYTLHAGASQFRLADAATPWNDNRALMWKKSGLTWSIDATVSLSLEPTPPSSVRTLPVEVGDWDPQLTPRDLGGGNLGCDIDVSGAKCESALALAGTNAPSDRFSYTRNIYGDPHTTVYQVQELYLTPEGDLVLAVGRNQRLDASFTLYVDPGNYQGSDRELRIALAEVSPDRTRATWRNTGIQWFAGSGVVLEMQRAGAGLDYIQVHYDGNPPVDGFIHHAAATLASYGYRAVVPPSFPSIYPDEGVVKVTHVKLKVSPFDPDSRVKVRKVTWDANGRRIDAPWSAVIPGEMGRMSDRIELDDAPNTYVDIEVTDGSVVNTYLLAIDPPQEQQTPQEKYADLIAQMYEWRNDPQWVSHKSHTDRWDRALLAFGETVSDTTLTAMTAEEARPSPTRTGASGGCRWRRR